jgi:antitoxin HicB
MRYRAKFEADGSGFLVTFPMVPEAISGGANEAEASANAADALEIALLTYAADGRVLPEDGPLPTMDGNYRLISISAATAAKLALITAFRDSGLTQVALAAKLGKAEGEIRRMLNHYHATKLASIDAALRALGKRLVVTVEEAA